MQKNSFFQILEHEVGHCAFSNIEGSEKGSGLTFFIYDPGSEIFATLSFEPLDDEVEEASDGENDHISVSGIHITKLGDFDFSNFKS